MSSCGRDLRARVPWASGEFDHRDGVTAMGRRSSSWTAAGTVNRAAPYLGRRLQRRGLSRTWPVASRQQSRSSLRWRNITPPSLEYETHVQGSTTTRLLFMFSSNIDQALCPLALAS